jgi:hypothetical protein
VALTLLTLAAGCGADEDEPGSAPSSAGAAAGSSSAADTGFPEAICTAISADDMGALFGSSVSVEQESFEKCTYSVDGSDITVDLEEVYENTDDLTSATRRLDALYGRSGGVPELGVPAVMGFGRRQGQQEVSAVGAVRRDDFVTVVTVTQGEGLSAETVRDGATQVLRLVAEQR